MLRILGPGLIGMVALAIWVFCVFDVIAAEPILIRNLPKPLWLMIVIFVPTVGAIAWLALGRPVFAGWRPGETTARPPPRRRILGPDDDPAFGSTTSRSRPDEERLRRWEDDLKRREQEFRRQEGPTDEGDSADPV